MDFNKIIQNKEEIIEFVPQPVTKTEKKNNMTYLRKVGGQA